MDSGEENDDGGAPVVSWLREDGRTTQRGTADSGVATALALASRKGGAQQAEVLGAPAISGRRWRDRTWAQNHRARISEDAHGHGREIERERGAAGTRRIVGELRNTAAAPSYSGELFRQRGREICKGGRGEMEMGHEAL